MKYLLLVVTTFFLVSVSADEIVVNDKKFELSLFSGYRISQDFDHENEDGDDFIYHFNINDGNSLGLALAWDYDAGRQGELLFSYSGLEFKDDNSDDQIQLIDQDVSVSYLHLGGNVTAVGGNFPVVVSGGLGATHFSPDQDGFNSETKLSLNVGVGWKVPLSDTLTFRLDGRGYATLFDGSGKLFCKEGRCLLETNSNIWFQGEFAAGITYSF